MSQSDILDRILAKKAEEVIAAQVARPFATVDAEARAQAPADEPTGWVPRSGGRARCRRFRPRADQDDGIRPGERVVSGAAYQVRLASLGSSVPAHGHEH